MYTEAKICYIDSYVLPQASGTKFVSQTDGTVDVNELHRLLNDPSCYVIIRNHTPESDTTDYELFVITAKLETEVPQAGDTNTYVDTYLMSKYSRNANAIANRKVMMSFTDFSENAKIKCTYFSS